MNGSVVRVPTPSSRKWSENLRLAFKQQCLEASESLGAEAMRNKNHNDAVFWYSAALDLNPTSLDHTLMKRSEAYAATGSWENVLMDVNEVYLIMDLPGGTDTVMSSPRLLNGITNLFYSLKPTK